MPNVVSRSSGLNPAEQYVAELAERTFLNLWSYPNPYKEPGKELCDLLVVCGEHVLIFSCKSIGWPAGPDVNLAWRRWYKRAIQDSAKQVRGAQRWLEQHADHVYLDAACTKKLPLSLPPIANRKVHGIVVAFGAGEARKQYFHHGIGSLVIVATVKEGDHTADGAKPFVIGDVDSAGPFIHVLDEATLRIVVEEFDTVTDFTDYLSKKEQAIRSRTLLAATGEEEMVAYYATHVNSAGKHDFTWPDGSDLAGRSLSLDVGYHAELLTNPQYQAKKEADRPSYAWDRLIKAFTSPLLAGTNFVPGGFPNDGWEIEKAVREMAQVRRLDRRLLGGGVMDAWEKGRGHSRYARTFLPGPSSESQETAFFFMTLARPWGPPPMDYEDYRLIRVHTLRVYADAILHKYRNLKFVVAIASEPPGSGGSSEDLIMVTAPVTWTDEMLQELGDAKQAFGIFVEGRSQEYRVQGDEYPEPTQPVTLNMYQGNRASRRRALHDKTRRR